MKRTAVLFVVASLCGCSPSGATTGHGPKGEECRPLDTDGDGIADFIEGEGDTDGDGILNLNDDDSDGDGILDSDEWRTSPCEITNSDEDDLPDPYDTDSDNDGVSDADEVAAGSDPTNPDTDGDGYTDLAEVTAGTDPLDATSAIPETDFFVVLPYFGNHEHRSLTFGTNIEVADVMFLVDMTGSMQGERTNLINGLVDVIIPGIEAQVSNVQFAVGGFDDYPYGGYGGGNDLPFYLLREVAPADQDIGAWTISAAANTCPSDIATHDIGMISGAANGTADILEAVQGLPCHSGGDGAESYVPAMWATATGEGLSWPDGSIPAHTCPVIPDSPGSSIGYPCFRPGALPIVVLFGDYNFHNGPSGAAAYSFDAPSYDETVSALTGIGARVVGIASGASATADFNRIATDTGAVRADGTPLVFTISSDGSGLDSTVVTAIAELVGSAPQDVSTRTENVPGNPDNFDATTFIQAITPNSAFPEAGVLGGMDATTFYGVIPGTQVSFLVDFYNDVRPPSDTTEIFQARIIVVGNGVADLDARNVFIIVPPDGTTILI